jgi:hypothetical protein
MVTPTASQQSHTEATNNGNLGPPILADIEKQICRMGIQIATAIMTLNNSRVLYCFVARSTDREWSADTRANPHLVHHETRPVTQPVMQTTIVDAMNIRIAISNGIFIPLNPHTNPLVNKIVAVLTYKTR